MIVAYNTMVAETTALFAAPPGVEAQRVQLAQEPELPVPQATSVSMRCAIESRAVVLWQTTDHINRPAVCDCFLRQ
jgi:hypothetical protein